MCSFETVAYRAIQTELERQNLIFQAELVMVHKNNSNRSSRNMPKLSKKNPTLCAVKLC